MLYQATGKHTCYMPVYQYNFSFRVARVRFINRLLLMSVRLRHNREV